MLGPVVIVLKSVTTVSTKLILWLRTSGRFVIATVNRMVVNFVLTVALIASTISLWFRSTRLGEDTTPASVRSFTNSVKTARVMNI